MTNITSRHLFVGGPEDGAWLEVEDGAESVMCGGTLYRRHAWEGMSTHVFAPEVWTPLQVVARLVVGYSAAAGATDRQKRGDRHVLAGESLGSVIVDESPPPPMSDSEKLAMARMMMDTIDRIDRRIYNNLSGKHESF